MYDITNCILYVLAEDKGLRKNGKVVSVRNGLMIQGCSKLFHISACRILTHFATSGKMFIIWNWRLKCVRNPFYIFGM